MRRLYTLLLYLALPFVALIFAARAWRERAAGTVAPGGWGERLGWGATRAEAGLWVHAVSVGEVQVAAVLIGALSDGTSGVDARRITLTCATPSARVRARALLPNIEVRYAPYDLPGAQRRWLARLRPRLLVLIEGELWPNLLEQARRLGVPTLIASARVSARSARRYRRLPGLLRAALHTNVWIEAQSPADAQRFRELGAPAERVHVSGNLKFDRPVNAELIERGQALRAQYAAGRPVWVAGSVHPGEAEIVLQAHRRVREHCTEALLVMAPRHTYRFEETAASLQAAGLTYQRRSLPLTDRSAAVLLLDTLGELMDFYAAADAAFVGGSLVSVGGHNLLEPAALGIPVLTGGRHFSTPEVVRVLTEHGALTVVADAASLAAAVRSLLEDAGARERQGAHARAALQAHRGALATVQMLIGRLLTRTAADAAAPGKAQGR